MIYIDITSFVLISSLEKASFTKCRYFSPNIVNSNKETNYQLIQLLLSTNTQD